MVSDEDQPRPITSRRNVIKLVAGGSVVGLAGCTGGGDGTETTTATTQTTESTGTTETTTTTQEVQMGGELVATAHTNVSAFDPTKMSDTLSRAVFGLVYEPLVAIDFNGKPQPLLAESYEQTEDLTFRFRLREGVTFHNGDTLTAEDVQKELGRWEGTSQGALVTSWYESSEIIDDHTIDLKLKRPYAPLLYDLSQVPILPSGVAEGEIDLRQNPVGSGPYVFEEYETDSHFRISRNEGYWFTGNDVMPEKPPIETVTFRIMPSSSAMLAALRSGDIDFINDVPPGSIPDLKSSDEFSFDEHVSGSYELLLYPQHEAADTPFQNRKVRRGAARLIPRQAVIDSAFKGVGTPAYAPISPLVERFTSTEFQHEMRDEYVGYDPERAKQLLSEGFSEAGYSKPFETTIAMGGAGTVARTSQLIKRSMEQTGFFDVTLKQYEVTSFVGRMTSAESHTFNEIFNIGFSGGWDPSGYVSMFHSNRVSPSCCNVNNFKNERVDRLIEQGRTTFDVEERAQIYEELQRLIVKLSPVAVYRFGMNSGSWSASDVESFNVYPVSSGYYNGIYAPSSNAFTWLEG